MTKVRKWLAGAAAIALLSLVLLGLGTVSADHAKAAATDNHVILTTTVQTHSSAVNGSVLPGRGINVGLTSMNSLKHTNIYGALVNAFPRRSCDNDNDGDEFVLYRGREIHLSHCGRRH